MKKKVISRPIENIQDLINGGDVESALAMQYSGGGASAVMSEEARKKMRVDRLKR
jgi:hypothetical protein